tara:strand:+ start:6099 stop:6464 length:366 start_codon:yes stop_codon:yes gene_type:complete
LRRKNNMSLSKKRKYEAVLLYLNAHHLELYGKIDNLLGDSNATLEEIRQALGEYAILESSFTALKSRWGAVINPAPKAPPPPEEPPPDESATGRTIKEAELFKRSAAYRKSMENKKTDGEK